MFRIKLKELREKRGLSQAAFAKAFGSVQSTVGSWESGAREPNLETIKAIANFFGVTVSEMVDDLPTTKTDNTSSPLEQQMGEIEFTLYGEMRDLSDEEKQDILDYARFKKQQKAVLSSRQYAIPVTIAAESGEKLDGVAAPDEADELSAFEEYKNN